MSPSSCDDDDGQGECEVGEWEDWADLEAWETEQTAALAQLDGHEVEEEYGTEVEEEYGHEAEKKMDASDEWEEWGGENEGGGEYWEGLWGGEAEVSELWGCAEAEVDWGGAEDSERRGCAEPWSDAQPDWRTERLSPVPCGEDATQKNTDEDDVEIVGETTLADLPSEALEAELARVDVLIQSLSEQTQKIYIYIYSMRILMETSSD